MPNRARIASPGRNDRFAHDSFKEHRGQLVSFVRRQLRENSHLADDIAQETFARVVAAERQYDPVEGRSLLYRIAQNLCIDHSRRERARARAESGLEVLLPAHENRSPDRHAEGRQEFAIVREAILTLPDRCREVYVLHRFEGLTYSEISAHCGISMSVVEKHMHKALKRLVNVLENR